MLAFARLCSLHLYEVYRVTYMVDFGAVCVLMPRDSNVCASIHWVVL